MFTPYALFHQYYDLRLAPFPNWLTYLILAPLTLVVQALTAEKILLSLYVILVPLSVWYLLDAIRPGKTLITLASFGLVYNHLLLMGFYSFVFSIPLVLITLGYWWKHRATLGWREIILTNLLCALIWLGHIVSYAIALFAIGLLALLHVSSGFKAFLKAMACILPSTTLFINYFFGSDIASAIEIDLTGIPGLFWGLVSMKVLVSYNATQTRVAYLVGGLFGLLVLSTLITRLRGEAKWRVRFTRQDLFLLVCLCLLVFYLLLPGSMGPGLLLNDRFALLLSLLLLAWFEEAPQRGWQIAFATLATLVALASAGAIFVAFNHYASGLAEYTAAAPVIQKGKVILPLFFNSSGDSKRTGIYVNAANYLALDNGGINLGNYEVQFDYFPVRFKNNFVPPIKDKEWVETVHWNPERIDLCGYASHIDYLETWGNPTGITADAIRQCYAPVFEQGQQRIYVPR
jgi:hypothetical protein